jgi:hypothetical protein
MDQTVLEEMVVRITGDISDLKKKLEEATQSTKDAARNTEAEVAKIGFAMNAAAAPVKYWAATAQTAFGMVKQWVGPTGALTTGFATTGEAMGALGGIAATIPGPWGAAVSAVLSLGGQVIDWFEGKLIKNQAAAKQGFLDIASGARTLASALDQINLNRMNEGMEKVVDIIQRTEGGVLANVNNFVGQVFGQSQESRVQREISRIASDTATRQRMAQRLMDSPELTQVRGDAAVRRIGMETREQAERLPERIMRRQMMRAMHGEDVEGGAELVNTLRARLAVMQTIRQSQGAITSEAEAERRIRADLEYAAQRTAQYMQQMRVDRAVDNMKKLADETHKATENIQLQSYGFGLTARESERYKIQVQLSEVESKLLVAGTSALNAGQRALLDTKRQSLTVDLETMRLFDRRLMVQESLQTIQQERATTEAGIAYMREQQTVLETNYRMVVDTTREETRLGQLRSTLAGEEERVSRERASAEMELNARRIGARGREREAEESVIPVWSDPRVVAAMDRALEAERGFGSATAIAARGALTREVAAAESRLLESRARVESARTARIAAEAATARPVTDRTEDLRGEIDIIERAVIAQRELREARERATMSLAATRAAQTPQERYDQEIDRLMMLRDALDGTGISYETYTRSVVAAGEALRGADPYFQALNRQVQEGTSIAARFSDPADRLESQVNAIRTAYQQGAVTAEEFQDSVRGLREEFERTNRAMSSGTFTAAGSLEGIMRLENFTERMRTRREELLPTQVNRTPGGIVSEAEEGRGYGAGAFGGVLGFGPFSVGAPVPSFRGSGGPESEATGLLRAIDASLATLVARTPPLPSGAEATIALGFAGIGL